MEGPTGDGRHFNISQIVVLHSPTGFEWGYAGSGPADFALNILELYARRFLHMEPDMQAGRGPEGVCTGFAWHYHQDFKNEFVAALPEPGGTIKGDDIRAWINARLPEWRAMDAIHAQANTETDR
jgi:hypothetical protein